MSFSIKDENGRKIEIYQTVPTYLEPYRVNHAETIAAIGDFGHALFHHYPGKGFSIWYNGYYPQYDSVLIGAASSEVLELHISLVNQIEGTWEGVKDPSLPPYRFGLSYSPNVQTRAYFKGGKKYITFDIHFEKWFLQRLAKDFPILAEFLEQVEKKVATNMIQHHFYCTPDMIKAIRYIHNPKNSERRHKHLLEYKVIEILLEALERAESEQEPRRPSSCRIEI